MRLIDLDKLLEFPIRENHYDRKNGNIHFIFGIETVMEYAESLPTVDAVQVVRCKDCEYKRLYDGETKYYYCALEDRPNRQWGVDDTDFCSWGERKDHETD